MTMGIFDDPNWPGLTFNPAKGDLHTIESLAYDVKTVGDELDEMREMLLSIGKTDGVWDGEAAKNFQEKVGELPKYLKQGHESMTACSKALQGWHDQLQTMQQRAKGLEDQALEARNRLDQKNQAVDRVNVKIEGAQFRQLTEQEAKALSEEADSASAAAKDAAADLKKIIEEGEALRKSWEEQAAKAEKAIREASENRPPDISIWDKITGGLKGAWDGFKNFLIDNADLFSTISSALAAAALVVNVVPVFGQAASAILGAGSVAFAGAAMAGHIMGGASPLKIGLDALGLIPGGKAIWAAAKAPKALATVFGQSSRMARAAHGLMDGIKNPLSTKLINGGIKMFGGKPFPPDLVSLGTKSLATGIGVGKEIFGGGGDEGQSSKAEQPVRTMPYPASPDKFHHSLAA
jgi:uncharacterized protein YukE